MTRMILCPICGENPIPYDDVPMCPACEARETARVDAEAELEQRIGLMMEWPAEDREYLLELAMEFYDENGYVPDEGELENIKVLNLQLQGGGRENRIQKIGGADTLREESSQKPISGSSNKHRH